MAWKPISTAPENTWVLLYGEHGIDLGIFDPDYCGDGAWVRMTTSHYDNDHARIEHPTHWMALPSRPKETQ